MINKIHNEDCRDTMARMPNGFVDLTITSPPYNMRLRVRDGQYTEREKGEHFSKKYAHFDDALPMDDFYKQHSFILSELIRVSKIVCYNFQIVTGSKEAFFKIIGDFSEQIKDIIIWDKGAGQPAMNEQILNSSYEMILVLEGDGNKGRKIRNAKFNRGEMSNIIRTGRGEKITNINNATFPEILVKKLLLAFSNENDLIYDPFMGSGTVAKVSHEFNRRWVGSEIVSECCEVANKRMIPIIQKISMF